MKFYQKPGFFAQLIMMAFAVGTQYSFIWVCFAIVVMVDLILNCHRTRPLNMNYHLTRPQDFIMGVALVAVLLYTGGEDNYWLATITGVAIFIDIINRPTEEPADVQTEN